MNQSHEQSEAILIIPIKCKVKMYGDYMKVLSARAPTIRDAQDVADRSFNGVVK